MPKLKRHSTSKRKAGASRQVPSQRSLAINGLFVKRAFIACLMALGIYAAISAGKLLNAIAIEEVLIYGNEDKVSSQAIHRLIDDEIQKGFWAVDLKAVKEKVESHSWVRKAMIKKQWPNKLVIAVDEQVPIARWDNDQLLSTTGDIIYGGSLIGYLHLPRFIADKKQLDVVITNFNDLQIALRKNQLAVTTLSLTPAGQWSFELNDDLLVKAGDEINTLKINRLINVIEQELLADIERVEVIDLRYPNGLSVQWHDAGYANIYALHR